MKIRAILVDDQSTGLAVLRDLLHHSEPDIEIIGMAANGREAVESINRLAPDLVFLDVQMPELDGFEVVAQMRLSQKLFYWMVAKAKGKPVGWTRLRSAAGTIASATTARVDFGFRQMALTLESPFSGL
ncbi:MAG: response regulator [Verrucomicrobiota bacterium]